MDLVAVPRVRRLLVEQPDLARSVFTEGELSRCAGRRRAERLAARFAAKEAVLKAFGTGLGSRMRFADVEVVNRRDGKPGVRLHGRVAELARERGLIDVDVSLSHSRELAIASAVAVWNGLPRGVDRAAAAAAEPGG